MKIYSVTVNKTGFQRLEFIKEYDVVSRLPVLEGGYPTDWNPPMARFVDREKPVADFSALGDGVITYDFEGIDNGAESSEWIGGLAEMAGGMAFITVENGPRQSVLFVTEACNALDRKKTLWQTNDEDKRTGIDKFAFHASRVFSNSGLFRLAEPVLDGQYLFAYDDGNAAKGGDMKFLECYRKRDMRGLEFTLVWSDTGEH